MVKLDLACGQRKAEGFTGVDVCDVEGVDIVLDLEQFPWPWENESVDEVFSSHYVEHTSDLILFMNEVWRILKPGGKAVFLAPYYSSVRAFQDPTHKRFISEASFIYFNKEWRETNKLEHYPIIADFDFEYGYSFYDDFATRSEDHQRFAVQHYWNVVSDIQVNMTKRT